MSGQIDDYVKRPIRYRNIDGLEELTLGVMWAGMALLTLFREAAPSNSIWHSKTTLLVCIAALLFAALYGQKVLRKRITHPRTGYVKYRPARTRLFLGVVAAVAIAIATVLVLRRFEPHFHEIVKIAVLSVGWGLMYAMVTRLDGAWRWVVLVVLIVAPPVVAVLPLGPLWLDHLPFVVQGLIFFVSGVIGLALYLRRNPPPEEAAE